MAEALLRHAAVAAHPDARWVERAYGRALSALCRRMAARLEAGGQIAEEAEEDFCRRLRRLRAVRDRQLELIEEGA